MERGGLDNEGTTGTLGGTRKPLPRETPLWASLGFTFSASAGSMIVQSGIFFLTTHTYGFSSIENYSLGVAQGLTYIVGALGAGPLMKGLRRAVPGLSSRSVLIGMMLLLALLCAAPKLALAGASPDAPPAHWPMWLMVLVYSPMSGMLWPMVESYISGGRQGNNLRSTIGRWNVVWSSSLIVSSFLMAPYVKHGAANLILVLAGVHVGCAALLTQFGKEPLPHPHESAHEVPPHYEQLLVTFRWLLPLSYLVCSAMIPFLPTLMTRLNIPAESNTSLAAIWLLFRTIGFAVLERSHGWHGRWAHPILALLVMLAGFAMVSLSYVAGGAEFGKTVLMVGLACFGLGMAMIYAGAIYYAMEVGQAQVEAGGAHEGLIGVGYGVGPAIGLGAAIAVSRGTLKPEHLAPTVLVVIAILALGVAGVVAWRIHALGRRRS